MSIIEKAGVELDGGSYLIHKIYDDEETLSLVAAACETLDLKLNDVLEAFGAHFLAYCVQSGYDRILKVLGRNLRDFLCNLDALHDHLATIYPGMEAPSFRCTETSDGTLLLHYYSKRQGLEHIVIGLVKAVAKDMLNTEVVVNVQQSRSDGCDHVVFAIMETGCKHGGHSKLGLQTFDLNTLTDKRESHLEESEKKVKRPRREINLLSFCKAFPFHLMFDRKLSVTQAGVAMTRVLNKSFTIPFLFKEAFELTRPRMEFTFEAVLSHINTVFIATVKQPALRMSADTLSNSVTNSYSQGPHNAIPVLRLKGQMIYVPKSDCILFLCSPRVSSVGFLKQLGIFYSDIPVHDATRDLIFMSHARRAERELVERLEETSNDLRKLESKLTENKRQTDELLHSILPKEVAAKLRLNQPVPAENYKIVTILFSDIVGFTALCSDDKIVPMDIVRLLNKLYTYFDMLSGMNDVYKVETIGDAYMVVGGLPKPCDNHAEKVAHMACAMMEAAQKVLSPVDKEPIKIRIGIHSGSVMAGVVGKMMPRYCLFGSTVTLANKMESGSKPGSINVSCETKRYLQKSKEFDFTPNTEIPNPLTCFFLTRSKHAESRPSVIDIAASVAPNSICMFRSPINSPSHSPTAKRRSETVPADLHPSNPSKVPPRRISSIDAVYFNEKLESLEEDESKKKRRRTTLPSLCPVFKPLHLKRGELSIDENDNEDAEDDDNGKGNLNGEASLIGLDEESLTELVELSQKIDSTL
ncbi:guanylate cyclase soluble subunit beta-1-like isoform X4 [Montipora foliosa]